MEEIVALLLGSACSRVAFLGTPSVELSCITENGTILFNCMPNCMPFYFWVGIFQIPPFFSFSVAAKAAGFAAPQLRTTNN